MASLRNLTRSPWFVKAAGSAAAHYLSLVWHTTRFDVEPSDALERIPKHAPIILAFWHGQHFLTPFVKPDGLRAKPEQKQGPADSVDTGGKSMRFDGNWREDKMSEADYMKAHADADAADAKAVQALIDEIKKAG